MNLQALLVSSDDSAADILGRVLPHFGIALDRSSNTETTIGRIQQQKFDVLIIDFDEPEVAVAVIEHARHLASGTPPLTVALVGDPAQVRDILSGGAHFVLYKPLFEQKAKAGLRAAAALLSRERRRAFRVPMQAPAELLIEGRKVEGILLDLSETGMEILTAERQTPGTIFSFQFQIREISTPIEARGRIAWANENGQSGVHFLDLPEAAGNELKAWLHHAALTFAGPSETVPHCKLSDLSLGGCYIESDAPFPEGSMIDLCLRTGELEIHAEGMVRVAHPGHGMGVEFPSRTAEQRAQVENLISFLSKSPETMLELYVSPKSLVADASQFEPAEARAEGRDEELEDPLLELLRRGKALQQDDFMAELRRQRTREDLASV